MTIRDASKPLLLDLFCGGGGAAMGYSRAGFDVVGIDIRPQLDYPFTFIRGDAISFLLDIVATRIAGGYMPYWAIHASPPCQPYSSFVTSASSPWNDTLGKDEPELIEDVRDLLREIGLPYVIENVPSAPLDGITLCGSMFGLDIPRHRVFETSFMVLQPGHPPCRGMALEAAARRGWEVRDMSVTGKGRRAGISERWSELLGIDWPMRQRELKEAIPPVYTQWLGQHLLYEIAVQHRDPYAVLGDERTWAR